MRCVACNTIDATYNIGWNIRLELSGDIQSFSYLSERVQSECPQFRQEQSCAIQNVLTNRFAPCRLGFRKLSPRRHQPWNNSSLLQLRPLQSLFTRGLYSYSVELSVMTAYLTWLFSSFKGVQWVKNLSSSLLDSERMVNKLILADMDKPFFKAC